MKFLFSKNVLLLPEIFKVHQGKWWARSGWQWVDKLVLKENCMYNK